MTTFTMKVTKVDCVDPNDTVARVYWSYTGTDGENTATINGSTAIESNPQDPFTPYSQLTEQQVVSWVLGVVPPEAVEAMQANLTLLLQSTSPPLPWSP